MVLGALAIEGTAKQNISANTDTGYTRNSISNSGIKNDETGVFIEVGATAKSAPNLEYGSSPHTSSTGSDEFVESITLWGKRKGMDESEIAQIIKHIRKYGTKPHPFFGPAFYSNIEKIKESIQRALWKI